MNVTTNGSGGASVGPRVHFNARKKMFQGKALLDGRWKTKAVPVNIQEPRAAQRWFDEWYAQSLAQGAVLQNAAVAATPKKTFRSLMPQYLATVRARFADDDHSYNSCKRRLEYYVLTQSIADLDIESGELDIGQVTAWIEWLKVAPAKTKSKVMSPLTVRHVVQTLRSFLVDARGKGWVKTKENPLLDPYIKKVLPKSATLAGNNTIIHLDAAQIQQLLCVDSDNIPLLRRVMTLVAVATGMRVGELIGLTWDDVDLKQGTVRVFKQAKENNKVWRNAPPKKNSHRVLPLHSTAIAALKLWRDSGWCDHVGRDPVLTGTSPDIVFCSPTATHTTSKLPDWLRTDLAISGLPPLFDGKHNFTFHALRRTFMSLLEAEGVDRQHIGNLAGHAGKTVGDRHYIAKNLNVFRKHIEKLPLPKPEELPWLP